MKHAIIIFARVPEPGQTKTGMMPAFGVKGCARLHTYFLEDIKRECEKVEGQLFICFTPDKGRGLSHPVLGRGEYYISQRESGLGEQAYQVIQEILDQGYDACILIGTDVPEVQAECLERAFDLLKQKDAVLGLTKDGEYYLMGMKELRRAVFEVEGYGQGSVPWDTARQIKAKGCTMRFTETVWNMNVYQDLQGYRWRMRGDKRLQNTFTGWYLVRTNRISVIVPVCNKEKTICRIQDRLESLGGTYEILFVGGGSMDRTMKQVCSWVKTIHSEKGWVGRMNTGTRKNHGDILFSLHYDSELPPHPLAKIRRVMKDHNARYFGIAFHSHNFFMSTCRVISNHQIKGHRVMFGGQGVFVDRSLFFHTGMFPEVPMVEDYQFSLMLKEREVELGVTGRRIYTSGRRFPKETLLELKLMWKTNRLRKVRQNRVPTELTDQTHRDVR